MRALDLCAGAGGFSLALRAEGFRPLGVEGDPEDLPFSAEAVRTHRAGAGHCVLSTLAAFRPRGRYVVTVGGVPCQPYSAAGRRGGTDTEKGRAFVQHARIARVARSRAVVLENVRGMLTWRDGDGVLVIERIRAAFAAEGFRFAAHVVLNAWHFGVPQSRERLFFVAFDTAEALAAFRWPSATHQKPGELLGLLPWVTVRQALGLGHATRNEAAASLLDRPSPTILANATHPGTDGARPGRRPVGELTRAVCLLDQPSHVVTAGGTEGGGGAEPFANAKYRGELAEELAAAGLLDRPATTIQGDTCIAKAGHHDRQQNGAVRLTVEQCALLQGFPAGFVFHGKTIASRARQVGNAVPWRLGAAVMGRVRVALEASGGVGGLV